MNSDASRIEAAVKRVGLPAPEYGESMWTAYGKLADAIEKLVAVVEAAPRYCLCHVASYDGLYGTNHTEACKRLSEAIAALEARP